MVYGWRRAPRGYYPPPYGYGRMRRGGNSCLTDACLLETGCCIGEALEGNCLLLGLALTPRLLGSLVAAPRRARSESGPLIGAIRTYRERISAHRPPCCRFTPSCSHYAEQAIATHGALRGLALTVRRLLRCRPGGPRGADPVPAR
jgi:putative membrane protein insertion efficiency factor